jgi:geranylgeranyl pyrophosphate synthase
VPSSSQLGPFLEGCRARIEVALDRWLPSPCIQPGRLHSAMRYAVLGGGKRLRPTLVYAAGQTLGLPLDALDGPACAVELIHAYSLVHDDLPAMDNDDLRRGKPTCHKAYDEATAMLVGDALQSLAFLVLASDTTMAAGVERRLGMIEVLARSSGSRGMAGGQALDLEATGQQLDLLALENIHIHKTGALIRASVKLAALSATPLETGVAERLEHYAACIGLAFQVRDDILDVDGSTATLGKTGGKDVIQQKVTYPSLLGMSASREKAQSLCQEALESLADLDERADPLRWIAGYIVGRDC